MHALSALVCLVALANPQETGLGQTKLDLKDSYGYTSAQVVKMGSEKWFALVYKKEGGETTHSMTMAAWTFGVAQTEERDKLIAKMPKADRERILNVRELISGVRTHSINIASDFSGGGTIWNLSHASTLSEVDDVIGVLMNPPKHTPRATQALVWERLAALKTKFKRISPEMMERNYGPAVEETNMRIMSLESDWKALLGVIPAYDIKRRERVMAFVAASVEIAINEW